MDDLEKTSRNEHIVNVISSYAVRHITCHHTARIDIPG
jgi:hypothetical protein